MHWHRHPCGGHDSVNILYGRARCYCTHPVGWLVGYFIFNPMPFLAVAGKTWCSMAGHLAGSVRQKLNVGCVSQMERGRFVVKYEVAQGAQSSLDFHQDGDGYTMMSYNILLNPASDFTGGGTTFRLFNHAAIGIEQGYLLAIFSLHCL